MVVAWLGCGLDIVCLGLNTPGPLRGLGLDSLQVLTVYVFILMLVLAALVLVLLSDCCFVCIESFHAIIFSTHKFIIALLCCYLSKHPTKSELQQKQVTGQTGFMFSCIFQGHLKSHTLPRVQRTAQQDQSVQITNDKFASEAAHFTLCLCYFSLCLFSPTFSSCWLDSSKFRAVTLREGFWQRRVVMEDRLPLQVPCCENPGRAARRIAADDLRCCSAGCCRASSCASLVSARPSSARECLQSVRRCYFGVGVREHLWGSFDSFFFFLFLFPFFSVYFLLNLDTRFACELLQQTQ